jgi:O-antigen ligase
VLAIYVGLLFIIPARFVVPGFGAAGPPAALLGVALFGVLLMGMVYSAHEDEDVGRRESIWTTPITILLVCYAAFLLVSWTIGKSSALSPLAASNSDRALLTLVSLSGITLFVIQRVRTWTAIGQTVDLLLIGAMFMCSIGIIQFFTARDLSQLLQIPGLVENSRWFDSVPSRGGFNRPFGTALHPIEFGVVSASLVPLAIWRAGDVRGAWRWVGVAMLGFAAMASLSRSAVLALAIGMVVMFVGATWRQRANLAVGGVVFLLAASAVVPGLVDALRTLFDSLESDPSVQARVNRTGEVLRLIAEHPWLGRGFGTYTNDEYLLLDNEIQKLAIETGVIGVAALAAFTVGVIRTAWIAAATDPRAKGLATALSASILGVMISWYTFDAFFYRILMGVLFINIGLVGSLWRVTMSATDETRGEELARSSPRPMSSSPLTNGETQPRKNGNGYPSENPPDGAAAPWYPPSIQMNE